VAAFGRWRPLDSANRNPFKLPARGPEIRITMADIQAFRGLRYDLGHVGSLSDVIAPPYDVIDNTLRDELYNRHPANVIRLILNRPEPGDEPEDQYRRAEKFFQRWQAEGVLSTEPDPAVYVYHQIFEVDGTRHTRRGFIAGVRLEPFGEGQIHPHEETMPGPKKDRLALTKATRANLSPVFGLYPDANSEVQELLETTTAGTIPLEATDHLGVVHRVWPVTDVAVIAQLSGLLGPKPIFIADGHHRYETACNYRDALSSDGPLDANHPANFVLMTCVGMNDPGMLVLPTHRLFRGVPSLSCEELQAKLGACFSTRVAGEGTDLAKTLWDQIVATDDQRTIGLYTAKDDRWLLATLNEAGQRRLAKVSPDQSDVWRGLGVSILHRLIVETLLDAKDIPKPTFAHEIDEVVTFADSGDYPLAALVMPATLEHIQRISELRERMPAKSTYFYPKLITGMVFKPLE